MVVTLDGTPVFAQCDDDGRLTQVDKGLPMTTPTYPAIGIVTNAPPCTSCSGAMLPDIVLGDFHQCSVCGCRRMVPKVAAAVFTCPVCFAQMDQAPEDHAICDSCGTHFAYDDCGRTHAELRALWIAHGRSRRYLEAAIRKDTQAAASGDSIRALVDEILTDLHSTWLASSAATDSDREIIQDDIDEYRARLAALLRTT